MSGQNKETDMTEVSAPPANDKDIAQDIRSRLVDKLIEVCSILNEARDAGLIAHFGLIMPADQNVRAQISFISIVRPL
jgi:hypothetical protein